MTELSIGVSVTCNLFYILVSWKVKIFVYIRKLLTVWNYWSCHIYPPTHPFSPKVNMYLPKLKNISLIKTWTTDITEVIPNSEWLTSWQKSDRKPFYGIYTGDGRLWRFPPNPLNDRLRYQRHIKSSHSLDILEVRTPDTIILHSTSGCFNRFGPSYRISRTRSDVKSNKTLVLDTHRLTFQILCTGTGPPPVTPGFWGTSYDLLSTILVVLLNRKDCLGV